MIKRNGWKWATVTLTVALALVAWVAVQASESTWVSARGDKHLLADGETFDVGTLVDGETRTFGSDAKQVTVTREGDVVRIERGATEEDRAMTVECLVSTDRCEIMTFPDDPDKIMVMIRKERRCTGADGDCEDIDVSLIGAGEGVGGHHVVIERIACDDEGECEHLATAGEGIVRIERIGGHGVAMHNVMVMGDHPGADVVFVGAPDPIVLRCPEGDATLNVGKDEADQVFLCPRHSVPMEKVGLPHGHGFQFKVKKKTEVE